MIHFYCWRLLHQVLKQVKGSKRYATKHKYPERSDSWLFQYGYYKKTVYGCCCRYSAAFKGFTHWLNRNRGQRIRSQIKKGTKV
jgi:hypothetical protein